MRKLLLAICGLAFATSAAFADPIADRQALMKANGKALGSIAPIVKGEKDFDAALVHGCSYQACRGRAEDDPAVLWPAGSDTGDTTSSPKIWEDMAGFQAAIDKFKADTAAAVAAAPADVDALKATVRRDRLAMRQLPPEVPRQEGLMPAIWLSGQSSPLPRCWFWAASARRRSGC